MSHSRRSLIVSRIGFVSSVGLLGAAGLGVSGCHDEAIQNIVSGVQPGQDDYGIMRTTGRYIEEGLDPKVALVPTFTTITEAAPDSPVVAGTMSCQDIQVRDEYVTDAAVAQEARDLLNKMTTIEQRLLQLTGQDKPNYSDNNRWKDIQQSRDDQVLGIRGYQWRDGPHGINLEAGLENVECRGQQCLEQEEAFRKTKFGSGDEAKLGNFSTSFPTSVSQGATFDIDLMRRLGEAMGDETAASGHNVLLTPCMNLLRNPLWGRAQETFGEDVFHLGRMASAQTWGLQQHVTGCAKHYMANNIELQRMYINVQLDERSIREVYGRHFEMLSREGGIGCMMASYNLVNGKKLTQHKHLLTNVLKRDFGFRGYVLTDWWAMPASGNGQGDANTVSDSTRVAQEAIFAGLDVEVPWAVNYYTLASLLDAGTVPWSLVDSAVLRVLEQKLRFKTAYLGGPWGPSPVDTGYDPATGSITKTVEAGHTEIAREVAEKGMVLLKNDPTNGQPTLPINPNFTKIALIGPKIDYWVNSDSPKDKVFDFTEKPGLGDRGSSRVRPDPALTVGPLQGLQMAAPNVTIDVGHKAEDVDADAEFVVLVVGLTAGDEGEEYTGAADRESLVLPHHWDFFDSEDKRAAWRAAKGQESARPKTIDQNKLITDVIALGKPMVVVVEAGGAVDHTPEHPWLDTAPAIVMAWYPGQRGGEALGQLLFGQKNFAGRLPVTWPVSLDQFPTFTRGDQVPNPMEYHVGYRWFDEQGHVPRFYFGHGLSYTTFEIQRLSVPCADVTSNGLIQVEVDVKNTGDRAGDEVVMVFASFPGTQVMRSKKELKGFARVNLQPGEVKRVSIPVRVQDTRYWDDEAKHWVIEGGTMELSVGPSSAPDKLLKTSVLVHPGTLK